MCVGVYGGGGMALSFSITPGLHAHMHIRMHARMQPAIHSVILWFEAGLLGRLVGRANILSCHCHSLLHRSHCDQGMMWAPCSQLPYASLYSQPTSCVFVCVCCCWVAYIRCVCAARARVRGVCGGETCEVLVLSGCTPKNSSTRCYTA